MKLSLIDGVVTVTNTEWIPHEPVAQPTGVDSVTNNEQILHELVTNQWGCQCH